MNAGQHLRRLLRSRYIPAFVDGNISPARYFEYLYQYRECILERPFGEAPVARDGEVRFPDGCFTVTPR